jgi:hypothetical protein
MDYEYNKAIYNDSHGIDWKKSGISLRTYLRKLKFICFFICTIKKRSNIGIEPLLFIGSETGG